MTIYTKTGDSGETSLLGGKRVDKSCLEMRVIGEVDELNAALGVVISALRPSPIRGGTEGGVSFAATELIQFLQNIQRDLFKIGAELASLQTPPAENVEKINSDRVGEMEKMIDEFWVKLPELKNFILPGGYAAGAHLHLARVICRRAERELVAFGNQLLKSEVQSLKSNIRPELYIYLNRLSDFLFATARWVNFKAGEVEIKV